VRALFVVPYPTEAPSNRLRVEQYFPYLEQHGVEMVLRPFMSSDLYNIRHAPGSMIRKVASLGFSTVSRFLDIRRAERADVIFVHREAFPVGGPFIEEKLAVAGPPLVFDFDDAIYLLNTGLASRTVGLLKRPSKTARIINLSTTVIAGNENLKAYASAYNRNIVVIPTPVDTSRFVPRREPRPGSDKKVVIGWQGSNTTAPYLRMVWWDYVRFPEFYLPKRTEQPMDYMVYWIDTTKQAALAEDMKAGRAYPVDDELDKDFYGIRQRFQ
jgi:glycosyltransferase involved in cell wall biosynthesis